MSEHLKYLGRRQELELEEKRLKIGVDGLINNLRDMLDPMEKIERLRTDEIAELAIELANKKDRYMETQANLRRIEEILGR